jgi:hypothetical protein
MKKGYPNRVKKFYARFFWRHCQRCGLQFKKEWGWKYTFHPLLSLSDTTWYLCDECGIDKDTALELFRRDIRKLYA